MGGSFYNSVTMFTISTSSGETFVTKGTCFRGVGIHHIFLVEQLVHFGLLHSSNNVTSSQTWHREHYFHLYRYMNNGTS